MAGGVDNPIETAIGAAVLAAAIAFGVYASNAGGGGGTDGYRVNAMFQSASGVSVGTDVRVAGVKVGRVVGLDLDRDTFRARATLMIQDGVELPIDTLAKVDSEGILGGSFVALEPGADDLMLVAGDNIELTQGSVSLLDLITQFGGGASAGDGQ